jgi:hypothetical protein
MFGFMTLDKALMNVPQNALDEGLNFFPGSE